MSASESAPVQSVVIDDQLELNTLKYILFYYDMQPFDFTRAGRQYIDIRRSRIDSVQLDNHFTSGVETDIDETFELRIKAEGE